MPIKKRKVVKPVRTRKPKAKAVPVSRRKAGKAEKPEKKTAAKKPFASMDAEGNVTVPTGVVVPGSVANLAKKVYQDILKEGVVNENFAHFNEEDLPPKEFIPTGIPEVDKLLGGGLPVGKMGELYGRPGSGKSSLCYNFGVAIQKAGGYVISIDSEHSWDEERFEAAGGNRQGVVRFEADTIEQVYRILVKTLQSQADSGAEVPVLVIIDTIAAAPLAAEMIAIANGNDFQDMGRKAKYLSAQMRNLPRLVGAARAIPIFVNQVRQKIGMVAGPWVDIYESTGGEAIKFYASWRMKVSEAGPIKSGEDKVGQFVRLDTIKCKTAPNKQRVQINLLYSTGKFDIFASLIESLKGEKHLRKYKGEWKTSEALQQLGMPAVYTNEDSLRVDLEKFVNELSKLVNADPIESASDGDDSNAEE